MIYHIDNNAIDLMRNDFLKIRANIKEQSDELVFRCNYEDIDEGIKELLYLKILKLEGEYRSTKNAWNREKLNVEIVSTL